MLKTVCIISTLLYATTGIFFSSQASENNTQENVIQVKVVSLEGCQMTPPTIALIQETAEEIGLQIELERVIVRTPQEAVENRHIGSPTVQFNGMDIDPAARDIQDFGIT